MANFLDLFRRKSAPIEPQSAVTLNQPGWLSSWGSGGVPLFGNSVSEETAMSVAAVYRCATLIAGVIASLDFGIYVDDPTLGRVPVVNKTTRLLTVQPFPGRKMTTFVWKEQLVLSLLLHGNAFSVIRYDQAGRVAALEFVCPWWVRLVQVNQKNIYYVQWPDGRGQEEIQGEDMIHIVGPSMDGGLWGMSRIRQNARNSVAMARSIEEVAGRAFDNAMSPKNVLKLREGTSPDAAKRLQAFLETEFSGKSNSGKTLFLDAGSDYSPLSMNIVDLALIDASKATTTQICAFFGVPPILLGLDQTSTWGSGIQEIVLGFLRFSLNSDLERIENELTATLCSPGQYIWFDRDQLLAMDAITAADVASKEIACGISTPNEIRRKKNRATVAMGDTPFINSANISLETAAKQPPRTAKTKPPPQQNGGESP